MKIELELSMPVMPNLLRYKMEPGKRQDGFRDVPGVGVGDLTDSQIDEFTAEWCEAFRAHCLRRRNSKEETK